MIVYRKNLYYAQELQKSAHNKGVKSRNYAPSDKIWLNSKYIKTKCNQKLETKFFGRFQVFHPIGKHAYKLEFPRKWRIHDIFHVLLLEQDTTRKKRVDKAVIQMEFDVSDNNGGKYKIEAIRDSAVYTRESESGYLSNFCYLIL